MFLDDHAEWVSRGTRLSDPVRRAVVRLRLMRLYPIPDIPLGTQFGDCEP